MDRYHLPLNITEKIYGRISLVVSIIVLLALVITLRFFDYSLFDKPEKSPDAAEEEIIDEDYTTTAHVVAFGNHIFDSRIYEKGSKNWNYSFLYENVAREIQAADCAIVSQITPLSTDHNRLSGYPSYLSPAELADGLAGAGFDVIAAAGCHMDDAGAEGIQNTIGIWKSRYPHIPLLGIHATEEDAATIQVLTINDIRVAFLNYTYGTSNPSLKPEESYMLDTFQKEKVAQAVSRAQSQSDCIIFIAHWGETGAMHPTDFQTQWASYLMSLGVHVIIGTHPMYPQPYGTIRDDLGHETTIFYSLGNFVSVEENASMLLGYMADFTIEKTVEEGRTSVSIKNRSVKPLVTHYNYDNDVYAPYFLEDYTETLAAHHSIIYSDSSITLAGLISQFDLLMSQEVAQASQISLVNQNNVSASDSASSDFSNSNPAGELDEYGGYYDDQGFYHDISGFIFGNDGYYDQDNNFYSYN